MILWHKLRWRIDAYLTGDPRSAEAEEALRLHLASCPDCRAYYDEGLALMRAARGGRELPAAGELERLTRRAAHLETVPRDDLPRRALVGAAAALAAALLVVIVLPSRGPVVGSLAVAGSRVLVDGKPASAGTEVREGELVVAVEGTVVLALEGGRDVTLAEGTVLAVYAGASETSLEAGHAHFAVEPGRGPFAVRAGATRVDVKGTVFAVSRKTPDDVSVAVARGRVEVSGTKSAVTLGEGQRTAVGRDGVPAAPSALQPGDSEELRRFGEELERALKAFGRKFEKAFRPP